MSILPEIVFGIADAASAVSSVPLVRHAARSGGGRRAVKAAAVLAVSLGVFNLVAIPLGMGWWAQIVAAALSGLALYIGRNSALRPAMQHYSVYAEVLDDHAGGGDQ